MLKRIFKCVQSHEHTSREQLKGTFSTQTIMDLIDGLAKSFMDYPIPTTMYGILHSLRHDAREFQLGTIIGLYALSLFPNNYVILNELGICFHEMKQPELSYDTFTKILELKGLSKERADCALFNQHFNINDVQNRHCSYDVESVQAITKRHLRDIKLVTLTITTCKRFDLFQDTMNSFIKCFDVDMIDEWICVDDNSCDQDRKNMQVLYPFFTFIWKSQKDKGHPRSMNIIKGRVRTPYHFHMEDDWKFFQKRDYIREALEVLNEDETIGQCLINKNYSEIESNINVMGGLFRTTKSGLRYYEHEFVRTDAERASWQTKYGNCMSSNYWPHYSLRPSLLRTCIYNVIGDFDEQVQHFEMEYASRYFAHGFKSVFFEGIYCIHTGRLTSEKNDVTKKNAYILNDEIQFGVKTILSPIPEEHEENEEIVNLDGVIQLRTLVLNLDRRTDRWENFRRLADSHGLSFLNYERFPAVDGSTLSSSHQLQRIFDGNDYNMQVGAVGCAMSYFKMFVMLLEDSQHDAYLFFEDDIDFEDYQWTNKFKHVCEQLARTEWDFVFLGHHARDYEKSIKPKTTSTEMSFIEKWDVFTSFRNSLGGTIGFMVSKRGVRRYFEFINKTRLINCIDTSIQKSADELDVFYLSSPLVFSECVRKGNDQVVDTDIQTNMKSLSQTLEQKIQGELDYYLSIGLVCTDVSKDGKIIDDDKTDVVFSTINIQDLRRECGHEGIRFYTFDESVIFIVLTLNHKIDRCFHIFKRGYDDNYTVA